MAAFAEQHAGVALETVTGMPQAVCNKLFRGELDMLIGLSSYFDQWSEIETEELTALQFAFMVRQKHPLVEKNNITEKDLSGFPLVLPESADPWIRNNGAITSLKPHYVTDDFSLVVSLLNSTDAVYPMHVSQQVIDLMSEDFHMIRGAINVRETHIAVGFMKHRIKTTAAKVFTDMMVTKFQNEQLEKLERLY
jgi:DNA-binding transcriptional LysR family regulator